MYHNYRIVNKAENNDKSSISFLLRDYIFSEITFDDNFYKLTISTNERFFFIKNVDFDILFNTQSKLLRAVSEYHNDMLKLQYNTNVDEQQIIDIPYKPKKDVDVIKEIIVKKSDDDTLISLVFADEDGVVKIMCDNDYITEVSGC